jgi:hypothetical protein
MASYPSKEKQEMRLYEGVKKWGKQQQQKINVFREPTYQL